MAGILLSTADAHAETVAQVGVAFSVPFNCSEKGRCLTDPFKSGLNVVLIGEKGLCKAETAGTFTYQYLDDFEATHLTGTDECFAVADKEKLLGHFLIAVIGAEPSTVRLVLSKGDK